MDIIKKIAEELQIKATQVEAAVKLIDEGCTIPFIARYRKEATGALNDEQLRNLDERLRYLRNLEDRKEQVIASIEEQGKLTDELKQQILAAETMVLVEDLYRPYKQKRRTRATIAKEKGLEPLAEFILQQNTDKPLEEEAAKYISTEEGKEVADAKAAIAGAMDIIAEQISDVADYRTYIRDITMKEGKLISIAKDEKTESVYETYYDYNESLSTVPGHRILAINRGEAEKFLTVKIEAPEERILRYLEKQVLTLENEFTAPVLKATIADAYDRLIAPAIEREIRSSLTEKAEDGAIKVFGKNLEQLLLQPPIAGKVVLGWDPAFRTGCKLAVVDATGKVLDTKVIYPTEPHNKVEESKREVKKLIDKYHVTLISCGNGTASRESEKIIADMIKESKNENGQPQNGRRNRPIGGCLPRSRAGAVHVLPSDGGSSRADGRPVAVPNLSGVAQRRQNHPAVQAIRRRRTVRGRLLLGGYRLSRRYGVTADYRQTAVPDTRPGQRL